MKLFSTNTSYLFPLIKPFHCLILYLMVVCHGEYISKISSNSPNDSFHLGNKNAIITCTMAKPGNLPVFFKHAGVDISEGCSSYQPRFQVDCFPTGTRKPMEYRLIINSIEWNDRGNWSCYHGTHAKFFQIKVLVAPVMNPLKLLVTPELSRFVGYYEGLSTIMGSNFITVGDDPTKALAKPNNIEGHGWKNSPFNLLDPKSSISLQCSTKCAYPQPKLHWNFKNTTTEGSIVMKSHNSKIFHCDGDQRGQSYQQVVLNVSCKNLRLYGKVLIYCATDGSQPVARNTNSQLSNIANLQPVHNSVFILCPGDEPPGYLTQAEVAAISIGCCLLIFLPFLLYIIHKKRPQLKSEDDPVVENML